MVATPVTNNVALQRQDGAFLVVRGKLTQCTRKVRKNWADGSKKQAADVEPSYYHLLHVSTGSGTVLVFGWKSETQDWDQNSRVEILRSFSATRDNYMCTLVEGRVLASPAELLVIESAEPSELVEAMRAYKRMKTDKSREKKGNRKALENLEIGKENGYWESSTRDY